MRIALLAAALWLMPAAALASGGVMGGNWGGTGASVPGRAYTYIALPMDRGTLVQAVRRDGGRVDRWTHLNRELGVPQVAIDGAMTGLSADGQVLVLSGMQAYRPIGWARFQVLNATTFRSLGRFGFPGRYAVAAISPHGRYVYLRRYTAPYKDPHRFELTVLDRGSPGAPRAITGVTSGLPASSVSDGRWTYTLFQRDGSWVEGLDTVTQATRRWEVPGLRGNDLVRLRLEGDRLHVGSHATLTLRP